VLRTGEGCFYVDVRENDKYKSGGLFFFIIIRAKRNKTGFLVSAGFSLVQHSRDH